MKFKTLFPQPLRTLTLCVLYIVNLVFWTLLLYLTAPIKFIVPFKPWREFWSKIMEYYPLNWIGGNNLLIYGLLDIEWDVEGLDQLSTKEWYLVVANHQSWVDIIVLQTLLHRKVPVLKFFMKRELIWLPLIGWNCWLLGFPFMYRHSKSYLKKHPEQKGKDIELTKKACARFKRQPIAVINFLEGTRFTPEKKARRQSPYEQLLPPKAGGMALVLSAIGEYLHQILDVTIIYPHKKVSFWQFILGKLDKIIVRVTVRPITETLLGDYENDKAFRKQFQREINAMWQEKDRLMRQTLEEHTS